MSAAWVDDYNRNAVWCRVIAAALVAAGVERAILCPGGRSAALALQLFHESGLRCSVYTDERAGAFVALGMARVTERPVAVCTTSGSAVANLLPALLEADAGTLALVLLTCDRPRGMRDRGAPQTTDQIALCAPFVRACADLEDPSDDPRRIGAMRDAVAAALATATAPGARGPVQVNVPLEGALSSAEIDLDWRPPAAPASVSPAPAPAPVNTGQAESLAAAERIGLRPGLRGLIVAGSLGGLSAQAVSALADATGYPLLADAASSLRRPAARNLVCEADLLVLAPELAATAPELVIRIGDAPVSHTVHRYLASHPCATLRIDARVPEHDFLAESFEPLCAPDAGALALLGARAAPGDVRWRERWLQASARARATLQTAVAALDWGDSLAAATVCNAPGFAFLHLANSMAIRHANLHVGPAAVAQPAYANRGLNGIDGTLATFAGELAGTGARGLLLVGDQAALHDLGALAALRERGLRGCVCIVNNGGGALFDLLDCAALAGYEQAIRNPVKVDFGAAAAAFDLPFRRCRDAGALERALAAAAGSDRVEVIEAVVPPDSLAREFVALYVAVLDGVAPSRSASAAMVG